MAHFMKNFKISFSFSSFQEYFSLLWNGNINRDHSQGAFVENRDFDDYYHKNIKPHLEEFERDRVSALYSIQSRSFLVIPAIALLIAFNIYAINAMPPKMQDVILLSLPCIMLALWWTFSPVFKYKKTIKEVIFPKIFSFFGQSFYYNHVSPLSVEDMKSSMIIPSFTSEVTEDYVRGVYEDVEIELMEATLVSGSGKNKTTKFDGIFIYLGMNKNFTSKTIVTRDASALGNWLADKFISLDNVKLEDPVFEREFEVYSNSQTEARYILTPTFMEQLLKLRRLFASDNIRCSFYNNRLLLMIPCRKDRFEPASIFQPATFIEEMKMILAEMEAIFKIIETLKLNQKNGL